MSKKDLNRELNKEDIQMSNKHMLPGKCKLEWDNIITHIRMPEIQNIDNVKY